MAKSDTPKGVKCSFCGKTQESVKKIVAGPGVYICNECIGLCNEIIESEFYANDEDKLKAAVERFNKAYSYCAEQIKAPQLIKYIVTEEGVSAI